MTWIIGFVICFTLAGAFLCIANAGWVGVPLLACAIAGGMIYGIVYLTKIYREVHAVRLELQKKNTPKEE